MTEATVSTRVSTDRQADPGPPIYTAADMLDVALAAYERGRLDAITELNRNHWNHPDTVSRARHARRQAETAAMRRAADAGYRQRGLPDGYQYRGGPVDWETSMPAGSGCAWLRRQRRHYRRAAA
jgi:hypothetical protein